MNGLRSFGQHKILSRHALNQGEWELDQQLVDAIRPIGSKQGAEEAAKALVSVAMNTVQHD